MNFESETIHVRQATRDDLPVIVQVERSAFPEARWASEQSLSKRQELFPKGNFVALIGEVVVGFANGFPIGDRRDQQALAPADDVLFELDGANWMLRNVAVRADCQGKGIGTALVEREYRAARDYGAECIRFTATPDLDGFYAKLGFVKIGDAEEFHGLPQAVWEAKLAV